MATAVSLVLFLCTLSKATDGYKILGVFPHRGKSHFDVFKPLLKALAEKGHELTVISHFPLEASVRGYLDVPFNAEPMVDFFDVDSFSGARYEKYLSPIILAYMGYKACVDGLALKSIQGFLNQNETFDLIITEYFNGDCYLGFAHKFKVPVISLSSCTMMPWLDDRFANPDNPSYIPDNFMDFSDEMTFFQRVENTVVNLLHKVMYLLLMDLPNDIIARRHFGDEMPSLRDLAYNTSLMLINTHFTLNLARPIVPNIVEVGGIHIGRSKRPPQVKSYAIFTCL